MILPDIFIATAEQKGRGVYTAADLKKDMLIESSPVIVMNGEDRKLLDHTLLHDYIFEWGYDKGQCCVALGYISLYNHSYRSNCEYVMNYDEGSIAVKTVRFIKAGEELSINYNGDWNNQKRVWFDVEV
jgi:uncharacterized protein